MRIYEEYESSTEKRQAQRASIPLSRRKITGMARGYILVFDENGMSNSGTYDALGSVITLSPGDGPLAGVGGVNPSFDYLRHNCRLVGFEYIPKEWQKSFASHLKDGFDEKDRNKYRRYVRIAYGNSNSTK